tara:strand:- start:237 stop:443 length:207 start_codon:yes stop_codon:yes gene_type:complete
MHTTGAAVTAFREQVFQATPLSLGDCRGLLTEHRWNPVDELVCIVLELLQPSLRQLAKRLRFGPIPHG